MNLSNYLKKYGRDGLRKLAIDAATTEGYLLQCIYAGRVPGEGTRKKLICSSDGLLTENGLLRPKKILVGRKGRSGRKKAAVSS